MTALSHTHLILCSISRATLTGGIKALAQPKPRERLTFTSGILLIPTAILFIFLLTFSTRLRVRCLLEAGPEEVAVGMVRMFLEKNIQINSKTKNHITAGDVR